MERDFWAGFYFGVLAVFLFLAVLGLGAATGIGIKSEKTKQTKPAPEQASL